MLATASAAATVANLGPGYDVLGLCLAAPRDVVTAELTRSGEVALVRVEDDGGVLSRDAASNCAGVAAQHVLRRFGPAGAGLRLALRKGLPLGSGLGSSAASAVAAAMAAGALVAPDVARIELLDACREGERLATGTPHPDNVAPSLLGGIVACVPRGGEAIEVVPLPVPPGLWIAAVKPRVVVRTADARAALPERVPMADAVANVANVAALVGALASGDLELVGRSLEDRLATPYRKALIPGFDAALEAARRAGAVGGGISGSGPTTFALAGSEALADAAAYAMVEAFREAGYGALRIVGAVDPDGARLHVEPGEHLL